MLSLGRLGNQSFRSFSVWHSKKNPTETAAAAKSLQSCPTLRSHRRQATRLPRPWDSPGKNTGVGFHFLLQCIKVKSESEVAQSCPTLSDPMHCSPPGSSVHGIFQARVLEWVAISFSNAGKWKVKVKSLSRVQLLGTSWTAAHPPGSSVHGIFQVRVLEWGAIAFSEIRC